MPDIGRNDPCHCGSEKKYKKCCEAKDQAKEHKELEKKWAAAEKAMPKPEENEAKPGHESHPPAGGRKPDAARPAPQRHQSFVGPKINMPRKSGGG
jgi:hypothetical protein